MAKIVTTVLVDDLDGVSEADETVPFSLDGVSYELHLTKEHAITFRAIFEEVLPFARRTARQKRSGDKPNRAATHKENQRIREWALKHGFEVPSRGRLRRELRDAYNAAHQTGG